MKKSASGVLASRRGSMYRSVRPASPLAAALLNGFLSILRGVLLLSLMRRPLNFSSATWVFPQTPSPHYSWTLLLQSRICRCNKLGRSWCCIQAGGLVARSVNMLFQVCLSRCKATIW